MIGYPTTDPDLQPGHTRIRTILLILASLSLAVLVGMAPASIIRRRG